MIWNLTRTNLLSGAVLSALLVGVACASGSPGAGMEPAPEAAPEATRQPIEVQATHPRVNFARTCVDCHENRTPEAVEDWRESIHGQTNTGCVVCHGDAEQEFMVRPAPELCMTCHDGELDEYEVVGGHEFRFIKR